MEDRIEEMEIEKEEKEKLKKKIKVPKYIGGTSRSTFKRAREHQMGIKNIQTNSFMLKHSLESHSSEDLFKDRFAIKVVKFTRSGIV